MAFTLSQAITEVRAIINEDTPGYWSDTQITSWIQQGVLDWTEKSLLLLREDTITLVTNQVQYTTSGSSYIDNAIRTIHAEYNNKALQKITYEQIRGHNARTLGADTTPAFYFDHYDGTTFTFYIGPTPSATENGNDVTVYFACRSDDITELPYEYQPHIFLFAAHKAKFRERQYQEAFLYYQQYVNNIVFARQDGIIRGIQETNSFRIK
jgi:hypothetical protein